MKKLILFILAASCLSCDIGTEADNADLHIYNDTPLSIRVYYGYEEEVSGSYDSENEVEVVNCVTVVAPGEDTLLSVQSDIFFSGNINVVYGGVLKNYSIDFNVLDQGVKHIKEEHFSDQIL